MHAIIEFSGKQYKIEEGGSIKVPRVQGKVGTKVTINKILYMEVGNNKTIGSPFVVGEKLDGEIVSHGRERKVIVFKFKRRKGYQKKNTHRGEYTILKFGTLETAKKQKSVKKAVAPVSKKAKEKKEIEKKTKPKTSTKKSASPKTVSKKTTTTKIPKKKSTTTKKEKE